MIPTLINIGERHQIGNRTTPELISEKVIDRRVLDWRGLRLGFLFFNLGEVK